MQRLPLLRDNAETPPSSLVLQLGLDYPVPTKLSKQVARSSFEYG